MDILIIEDDQFKLEDLKSLVFNSGYPEPSVARSVNSAKRAIKHSDHGIVILDMSLPRFDIENSETGGKPQGFGGFEVLRYLRRKKAKSTVVIVTQFKRFFDGKDEKDLDLLAHEMMRDFPDLVSGVVFYDGSSNCKELILDFVRSSYA